MSSVLQWLLGTARFVPHGVCLLWRPDLVAIHVVSDALIALSYFAIPGAIWWFVRRRPDLEPAHRRMALLFVVFITACGLTHVAAIVTLWAPYYGLQAVLKIWTALASVATAAALPFLVPKLLKIPSPNALQQANLRLQREGEAHQATLRELEAAHAELAHQVGERGEDLRLLNDRFSTGLRNSPVTLIEQDQDLRYTWAFNTPLGLRADGIVGGTEMDFFDPATAVLIQDLKRQALTSGEAHEGEVAVAQDGQTAWFAIRAQPHRLRDGSPGLIASSIDITAQKQQQEHLELVMRELNHRSKNLLTIVQSIARQTAVGLDLPETFLSRLGERLRSLAAAHDVLVKGNWGGADVRAVIESQLNHQLQATAGRISLEGDRFEIAPEAAHYLGLAVHELGANAAKYGSLSTEVGRVEVRWGQVGEGDAAGLRLAWREAGGPKVAAPSLKGFGLTILEVLTPKGLGGEAELQFGEDGLTWTLTIPVAAYSTGASRA